MDVKRATEVPVFLPMTESLRRSDGATRAPPLEDFQIIPLPTFSPGFDTRQAALNVLTPLFAGGYQPWVYVGDLGQASPQELVKAARYWFPGRDFAALARGSECLLFDREHFENYDLKLAEAFDDRKAMVYNASGTPLEDPNFSLEAIGALGSEIDPQIPITRENVKATANAAHYLHSSRLQNCCFTALQSWIDQPNEGENEQEMAQLLAHLQPYFDLQLEKVSKLIQGHLEGLLASQAIDLREPLPEGLITLLGALTSITISHTADSKKRWKQLLIKAHEEEALPRLREGVLHVDGDSDDFLQAMGSHFKELTLCRYGNRSGFLPNLSQLCPGLIKLTLHSPTLFSLPPTPASLQSLRIVNAPCLMNLEEGLPSNLKTLLLEDCKSLYGLEDLPDALSVLIIASCPNLKSLKTLPPNLKTVGIGRCDRLEKLPPLPPVLKTLDLLELPKIKRIPELPILLEQLRLIRCKKLTKIPPLNDALLTLAVTCPKAEIPRRFPANLIYLRLKLEKLSVLPNLPHTIRTIDLNCKNLKMVRDVPFTTESFRCRKARNLKSLPYLPDNLRELDLSGCDHLQTLQNIPRELRTLSVDGCKKLTLVEPLPESLMHLLASKAPRLGRIQGPLPNLRELECEGAVMPNALPSGLEVFSVARVSTPIPPLPTHMKAFSVRYFNPLHLPLIPQGVTSVTFGHAAMEEMPPLPKQIKHLELDHIRNLVHVSELPEGLETLDLFDCKHLKSLPPLRCTVRAAFGMARPVVNWPTTP